MHKSSYDKFAVRTPGREAFPGVKGRRSCSPILTLSGCYGKIRFTAEDLQMYIDGCSVPARCQEERR